MSATDERLENKRRRVRIKWTVYATLGIVCVASFISTRMLTPSPTRAEPQPLPDVVRLPGTIRDFQKAHPDMMATPSGGDGHYAGNIDVLAAADGRPTFTGAGYRVESDWTDVNGNAIAPHLYEPTPTILLGSAPYIPGGGQVDTYDPDSPYGSDNMGAPPVIVSPAPMPVITVPPELEASSSLGKKTERNTTLTGDRRYRDLTLRDSITIVGATRILTEEGAMIANNTSIVLEPGATLEIYSHGDIHNIGLKSEFNVNTADPDRVEIYVLGDNEVYIANHAQVYANITAPEGVLDIRNHADFYGTYIGDRLEVKPNGGFHMDQAYEIDSCGDNVVDTLGVAGIASTGGITSAATFHEWYHDTLGVNLSMPYPTLLQPIGGGVFEFATDDFHPIDGVMFGNEGEAHNHYFTYHIQAPFTYESCAGQFFEFEGVDDVWVMIDGKLAMDLGGMGEIRQQNIDMDRLGLEDGVEYELDLFHAQRQPFLAAFRIRTNIIFNTPGPVSVSGGFD